MQVIEQDPIFCLEKKLIVCIQKHNWMRFHVKKINGIKEVMLMTGDCPCSLPFAGLGLSLAPVEAAARLMALRPTHVEPRARAPFPRPQSRMSWGYGLLCSLSREIRGR